MKKKLLKTISIASLSMVVAAPLLTSCNKKSGPSEYHIMSMSDIRGEIPGYGDIDFPDTKETHPGAIRTIDAMQQIAEKSADYVVLSGGDQNSSGKFSACTQGDTMYPVLKAMGVRYSAVGNHAWDWGEEKLENPDKATSYDQMGRTDKTEGRYFVSSNIITDSEKQDYKWEIDQSKPKFLEDFNLWNSTRVKWADPYKVLDLGGHKICLIGLTTRDTINDGNQLYIEGRFSFIDYNASVNYSKYLFKTTDSETFNKIESFILLTHCGASQDDTWISGDAANIANTLNTPIDAVLAAHTQTPVCGYIWNNKFNKKVAITQVPDKMKCFADLKIEFDDSKPVGQRFKNIEPKIIYPKLDGSSFEAGRKEYQEIINHPRNEIVNNVVQVYQKQKKIALEKLQEEIGTTDEGLTYYQSEYLKNYKYPEDIRPTSQDKILVEQAGAFTAKSLIGGFNKYFDERGLSPTVYKKANIALVSNDSINRGIETEYLTENKVTLNELYNLFPYDEHTITASLTYYQLEQLVRYMFTGKNSTSHKDICTDEYSMVEDGTPIRYSDLALPYGPTQFYGFAFKVKNADKSDKQYRKYDYVGEDKEAGTEASLVVYDPENDDCKLDDISTWKGKDYWKDKYITIVLNSFNFNGGNNQFKMIQDFATFNENENPEPIHIKRLFSIDVRDLSQLYIASLTEEGKKIALSYDDCKKLAHFA